MSFDAAAFSRSHGGGSVTADAETIAQATTALDQAIMDYSSAVHGTAAVVDWYLISEVHHAEDGRSLKLAQSPTMTPWKCEGLIRWLARAIGIAH